MRPAILFFRENDFFITFPALHVGCIIELFYNFWALLVIWGL